ETAGGCVRVQLTVPFLSVEFRVPRSECRTFFGRHLTQSFFDFFDSAHIYRIPGPRIPGNLVDEVPVEREVQRTGGCLPSSRSARAANPSANRGKIGTSLTLRKP
ncbi:MAG: hypothetical protein WD971_07905, partial [Pirellulales bacterium]